MNFKFQVSSFKLMALLVMVVSGIAFHTKPLIADISPKKILSMADEARGNVEGIEWEIKIEQGEGPQVIDD